MTMNGNALIGVAIQNRDRLDQTTKTCTSLAYQTYTELNNNLGKTNSSTTIVREQ